MVARDLLRELEGRGVRLVVEGGQLLSHALPGAITPELGEQIRAHKADLIQALQPAPKAAPKTNECGPLAPLPEPLVLMVRAAVSPGLNLPAKLPGGGLIGNLGDYVLAAAALYAAGLDPEKQLKDLWAARAAWAA